MELLDFFVSPSVGIIVAFIIFFLWLLLSGFGMIKQEDSTLVYEGGGILVGAGLFGLLVTLMSSFSEITSLEYERLSERVELSNSEKGMKVARSFYEDGEIVGWELSVLTEIIGYVERDSSKKSVDLKGDLDKLKFAKLIKNTDKGK